MKIQTKKFFLYFLLIIIIFFIDRISKLYVINLANTTSSIDIQINNFLNIILIWNKGIGFGLFSFDNNKVYNFITFLILTINLLIIYLIIKSDKIRSLFYVIILGGSLGNLFDRFYYTAVPDFIDLNYKGFHWFIFNIADIFISLGIICLICFEFLDYKKKNNV
tara:strand:- start:106 stop:597 length:492 start_codon:yes stop_codon:yes gene_type:complete